MEIDFLKPSPIFLYLDLNSKEYLRLFFFKYKLLETISFFSHKHVTLATKRFCFVLIFLYLTWDTCL